MDTHAWVAAISASILSGIGTALFNSLREASREKNRRQERQHDLLKLEVKDLQITLYKLEKDLSEWKDKYFLTVQELIEIKAALEASLVKLSAIDCSQHDL